MLKLIISNKALKEIDNLPDNIFLKIDEIIQGLKNNPRPIGCIKLTDIDGYRIRVGNYRILYTIDDKLSEIRIFNILHRKDAYKKK